MTKKHWAYLLIAFGLAMIYSLSQITAGKTDASTTMGKLEVQLGGLSLLGNSATPGTTTATTPFLAYGLIGVGAWLLFG